jgi:hypothetical protein
VVEGSSWTYDNNFSSGTNSLFIAMSLVSLLNVQVLNNPAKFTEPYKFEISFECLEELKNGKCVLSRQRRSMGGPVCCSSDLVSWHEELASSQAS